ncbi:MAG: hypothetical protein M1837_003090 [Sclerophora amabilis]|nr:MAG: hypothetical protein M1837_003090 [Sclerophora amabilis]
MSADERIIGRGASANVSLYSDNTVLKGYVVWLDGRQVSFREPAKDSIESLAREREVYERLGSHPNIIGYLGVVEVEPGVDSLQLELASKGDLRAFIRKNQPDTFSNQTRLAWLIGIASALAHIHSRGVFQCDFSCRNLLLTGDDVVKLCDFGGSKIDDKKPDLAEEPWYDLPLRGRKFRDTPFMKRELFAFGCAIYEIMAWKKPFGELSMEEVEKAYAREEFPDTSDLFAADIIRRCWNEEFESAQEVEVALQGLVDQGEEQKKTKSAEWSSVMTTLYSDTIGPEFLPRVILLAGVVALGALWISS